MCDNYYGYLTKQGLAVYGNVSNIILPLFSNKVNNHHPNNLITLPNNPVIIHIPTTISIPPDIAFTTL